MATIEIIIPKLGESVIEATITRWLKAEGDLINEEDPLVEIATDKVDSEIPSPFSGKLLRKLVKESETVAVGKPFALIETAGDEKGKETKQTPVLVQVREEAVVAEELPEETPSGTRYYSPLVRSIAQQEHISMQELDTITGSGKNDRLTRQDLMNYLKTRSADKPFIKTSPAIQPRSEAAFSIGSEDQIIEMDRIRQLISGHMMKSVQTSAHVTSFMEADMSQVVRWREKNKDIFQKREKEKLTYTPIFIEAIAKAVRDFPLVNVSVDGTKILVHHNINVGMAVALPNFNLIVPVIRDAHEKSLLGIIKNVNDLAERARTNKLVPDEISGGTISLTNLGSFGTLMGTPIINQPQTAIIAVGSIKKKPVVIEAEEGDSIAIRPVMMISVTYDHRVIDGALGGQFLSRIVQYLEKFDSNQPI